MPCRPLISTLGRSVKKWVASCVAALLTAIAALALVDYGVSVDLKNVGVEPMRGVVVHVTGASYPVGDLAPSARVRVKVQPRGESHVEIEHSAGQRFVVDCYFEAGYSGTLSVDLSSTRIVAVRDKVTP
jgi:hypothetical protein